MQIHLTHNIIFKLNMTGDTKVCQDAVILLQIRANCGK